LMSLGRYDRSNAIQVLTHGPGHGEEHNLICARHKGV
jgi:hypothetical protein